MLCADTRFSCDFGSYTYLDVSIQSVGTDNTDKYGPVRGATSRAAGNDAQAGSFSDGVMWFDAIKPDDCPVWNVGHTLPGHIKRLKRPKGFTRKDILKRKGTKP